MKKFAGLGLAATLLAVGCGGGTQGSRYDYRDPGAPPPLLGRNFTVENFGPADVASLIRRNVQTTETGAGSIDVTSTTAKNGASAPSASPKSPGREEHSRGLPWELRQQEKALLKKVSPVQARASRAEIRPRFEDPQGSDLPFFVVGGAGNVTCRKVSDDANTDHTIVWSELDTDGNPIVSDAQRDAIIEAFEDNNPNRPGTGIYQQVRALFGHEWDQDGGRDANPRINLVFLTSESIGGEELFGFFRPGDEYAQADVSNSNQGEILYINADKFDDPNDVFSTMAHEFTHMVNFNTKFGRQGAFDGTDQLDAIDEGQAVLAEEKTGFGLPQGNSFIFLTVQDFLQNPSRQGIFEFDGPGDGYGRGYCLQRYLYDRFGEAKYIEYAQSPLTGLTQLESHFGPFGVTFGDWTVAMISSPLLNTPSQFRFADGFNPKGTYFIQGANRTLPGWTPQERVAGGTQTSSLPPWSAASIDYINGTGADLRIGVQGGGGFDAGVVVQRPEGTFSEVK